MYRERNRIFGVNGFEFYELLLEIISLKNIFYMMPGFSGHNKNNMPLPEWQSAEKVTGPQSQILHAKVCYSTCMPAYIEKKCYHIHSL